MIYVVSILIVVFGIGCGELYQRIVWLDLIPHVRIEETGIVCRSSETSTDVLYYTSKCVGTIRDDVTAEVKTIEQIRIYMACGTAEPVEGVTACQDDDRVYTYEDGTISSSANEELICRGFTDTETKNKKECDDWYKRFGHERPRY
ncbi:MAG: hypothetical protein HRU19_14350 [Pseudobacteriovorax sp.]|nr:hypothetical protein [Pseudobacteriovorax sp.]